MENTHIQWATHTFNPWIGCTKVSPGCKECYAEWRYRENWGKGKPRHRTGESYWRQPMKWNREAENEPWICRNCCTRYFSKSGTGPDCDWKCELIPYRPRIFPSLCDPFDSEVPIEWLGDFLKLILDTPNLDWLLLTKRPGLSILRLIEGISHFQSLEKKRYTWIEDWVMHGNAPKNVWIGTSVEDQKRADERIPVLLEIPANIRFLSVEPMLELVRINKASWIYDAADMEPTGEFRTDPITGKRQLAVTVPTTAKPLIHWVIFGGESHLDRDKARPCNTEWIRDGVRQCRAAGVAPFVKQLGSNPVVGAVFSDTPEGESESVQLTLKHRKGGDPSEWPIDLRVREFPYEPAIAH